MPLKVSFYFGAPLLLGIGLLALLMLNTQRDFQTKQLNDFAHVLSAQLAASAAEPLFADANMELSVLVNRIPLDTTLVGAAIYNHLGGVVASNGLVPITGQFDLQQSSSYLTVDNFNPPEPVNVADSQTAIHTQASSNLQVTATGPTSINLELIDPKQDDAAQASQLLDTATLDQTMVFSTPITFRDIKGGHAVLVFNQSEMNQAFEKVAMALLSTALVIFILLCAALIYCSYRITSPVRSIVNAAHKMQDNGNIIKLERRNDELGQLIDALNSMNEGLAHKSQIEDVLSRFLAPDVSSKILNELDPVHLRGENVEATVLFADIVGFTSMSERMSPSEVSELLNEFFGYYSACARFYFGTIDKFLGDCIMLVFGAAKHDPKHAYNAAACAVLMQQLTEKINALRVKEGKEPIYLRIGINSGPMLAGLLGSADRMEYTVIGDSVNLASRLCNEAKQNEVIIQQSFYEDLKSSYSVHIADSKTIRVRGKKEPVPIYNLLDISQARNHGNRALLDDILQSAEAKLQQSTADIRVLQGVPLKRDQDLKQSANQDSHQSPNQNQDCA